MRTREKTAPTPCWRLPHLPWPSPKGPHSLGSCIRRSTAVGAPDLPKHANSDGSVRVGVKPSEFGKCMIFKEIHQGADTRSACELGRVLHKKQAELGRQLGRRRPEKAPRKGLQTGKNPTLNGLLQQPKKVGPTDAVPAADGIKRLPRIVALNDLAVAQFLQRGLAERDIDPGVAEAVD